MHPKLNVEKWAHGKPALIALSAVQLVSLSDFLYEILPQTKERRLFGRQFPLPDLLTWFKLYNSPLKPLIAFAGMIVEFSPSGQSILELFFSVRYLRKLLKRNPNHFKDNPPTPEEWREGRALVKKLFSSVFAEINDDLNPQPVDTAEKTRFFEYLNIYEQELGFFFFLFIPCLMIFQTSPHALYVKAVAGDIEAIEKLLKLDPLLLHEPAIGQHIQQLRLSGKTNDYERVMAAIHKLAITDLKGIEAARKRSKVELASILSSLSRLTGRPLNSAQISDLFHAYAKDKNKEHIIDTDLPVAESFNKAIKRHSPPWHNLFQNLDNKI